MRTVSESDFSFSKHERSLVTKVSRSNGADMVLELVVDAEEKVVRTRTVYSRFHDQDVAQSMQSGVRRQRFPRSNSPDDTGYRACFYPMGVTSSLSFD